MTNVKISDLTENTNPSGQEELVYAENGSNGKIKLDTIKNFNKDGLQETKYKADDFVSPTNMVEVGDSKIKIVYTYSGTGYSILAEFTSGESDVDIYVRQNSSSDYIKVHTFNPGFAPLGGVWYQNFFGFTDPRPDSDLLVLWNRDHIATFASPRGNDLTLHFSTEHRVSVADFGNIDFSVPVYSMFDISMINPSDVQENSIWFSGIHYLFNRILLQGDSGYMNYWNWAPSSGVSSYFIWLSPEPGTMVSGIGEFVNYQYGTIDNICPVPLQTPRYTWIVRNNTVQKVEVTGEFEIGQVLSETNINLGGQITLGTFNENGGTAGGKERAPTDTSLYYLGYNFSNKLIAKNDPTILKATDIKNDLSIETSETQTYNGAVIKAIDNKITPISHLEYNYDKSSNGSFSNDSYLYDFVLFHNDNNGLIGFSHDNYDDLSSWRLISVDEYLQWGEILDSNNNPIVLQDETGDNSQLRSLCINEDGTKILCFTATGKFYYYTMSTPYDYETITYSGSYETIDSNVTVPMVGAAMSPNGKYVYIMEEWTGDVYVYKTATPYSPASLTYINTFNHGATTSGGTPGSIRQSIGFSPDGKYALILGNMFENKEKFLIDGTIVQNMSEDNWLYLHGGYTLSTPLSDRIILNKTLCWSIQHTGYGNIKFPSWNSAINAAAEAFAPVTDTTSTDELVITNLTTVFTPTEGFSLSCGIVKPGMSYIVRLTSGATAYTMTLDASVTNPYNETLTLTASKTTTIVLLATSDSELEIQSIRTATSSSSR